MTSQGIFGIPCDPLDLRRNQNNKTILNGDLGGDSHSLRVVEANGVNATAIIDGFTITGGKGTSYGCGMFIDNKSSPTVRNCTFLDNWSYQYGGGMCIRNNSSPTLENCHFLKNKAISANSGSGSGGGLYISNSSNPKLTNCTFSGNEAKDVGGGMYINGNSKPELKDCTFLKNEASGGGRVYNGPIKSDRKQGGG